MTWTTIPPWLYQNDLPDDELQEFYVREARQRVRRLARELAALDAERTALAAELAEAEAFLRDAAAALARYRPPPPRRTERKRLPKP